ncbi:uncharacterized protein LOC123820664 isoform X2 [Phyllostomus hastatus]|uniref:uncharacterized protein LOC123820664 isoform X2 n=1 Tax=Phyllostomus hastatus TaxID=9423 RepID=UPI001E683320|nr:uncharacterized protein LOC123820664 isoform X2 [Phyllostomus hastatus]
MEENRSSSFQGSCVCQLLQNTSEKLCFQLTGTTCPRNLSTWDKNLLSGPLVKMNWTNCSFQDSRASNAYLNNTTPLPCLGTENSTTLTLGTTPKEVDSFNTAAAAISGSIGVVAIILLLVGLLSMTLKKWRRERLFKKQLRHQTNFLHKSSEPSCHVDAIYSNVINLAPWKEDDFAVYANMPPFDYPRRTTPHQVEYASIVFY